MCFSFVICYLVYAFAYQSHTAMLENYYEKEILSITRKAETFVRDKQIELKAKRRHRYSRFRLAA